MTADKPYRGDSSESFSLEQLDRLDKVMVVVAAFGLIVNVMQMVAMSKDAWLKATALADGQPFTAHLSLGAVTFGDDDSSDAQYFCQGGSTTCSLSELCSSEVPETTYANGLSLYTPSAAWCKAQSAGLLATTTLSFGLLLGLVATGFTGMYAAQAVPWVADQFDKVEALGFSDEIQKYIIAASWGVLWVLILGSMFTYSAMIPDSLGWGEVELELCFGLLRVCFVLSSVNVALVINSLFQLWSNVSMLRERQKIFKASLLKKALYALLALQLAMYFFLFVDRIEWSGLLIILAVTYLSGGQKSLLLMYVVFLVVSILFDSISALALPSFDRMTPGEYFGSGLFLCILSLKFILLILFGVYEYLEGKSTPEESYENFEDEPMSA